MATLNSLDDVPTHPDFAKYHSDHPTAQQIVEREQLTGRLSDKVVLITGASSGIGVDTARALYHTGARVFLAVRDMAKTAQVAASIEADGLPGRGAIELLQLDMTELDSVRQCAAAFVSRSQRLHVLVCNAGVMYPPPGKTKDKLDVQFGVNHVAHFLLFQLLKDTLLASSTPAFKSRVVVVGSSAHRISPVVFDDLNMDKQPFNTYAAYGQSKTANAYMALELERRYGNRGLHSTVVHPGGMPTPLARHMDNAVVLQHLTPEFLRSMKTVEQGAATTVWAAVSTEWEGKGGKYLEDVSVAQPSQDPPLPLNGYAPYIYDVDPAKRLWTESLRLVGMEDDGSGEQ